MPLIRPSCQRTPLSNQLPCSVTSPLPTPPTRKASGWRMDRRFSIHGQSRGTQHTGDKQLLLSAVMSNNNSWIIIIRTYFGREDNADNKCFQQWKVDENLSTIYQNVSSKMEVAMRAKNNAEVIVHSQIWVSNSGVLEKFLSENAGEQALAETQAVYWLALS